MNILNNKKAFAAKTIMMDREDINTRRKTEVLLPLMAEEGLYQSSKLKVLGSTVAQTAMRQGAARINAMNEIDDQQEATDLAMQNAEGKGMEEAKRREDERLEQVERSQPKRTFITPMVPQKKSHILRNTLIVGGISSAALLGGVLTFPFFGNV